MLMEKLLGGAYSSLILPVILFLFAFGTIEAQQNGTLRGYVTDFATGEALPFGNALIKELSTGSSTDINGFFIITSIPADKEYNLIVSYVGYVSKLITFKVEPNKVTHLNISLEIQGVELGTIEKVGKKVMEENATDIGLQRISIKDLEKIPQGVETDVFRSLQSQPGVRTTGDVSARYYVRGGASNQNLVLFNGLTVYNPFHAMGLFSAVDPEMINSAKFYKGGFTAEYGSRLSSVLDLVTKDGNKNNFGGKMSASFLSTKILAEGPLPNGSFILTGRKSTSTEILKKFFNDKSAPIDFYDMSFKFNYRVPSENAVSKFTGFGFVSNDQMQNSDPLKEDFNWANNLFGFTWFLAAPESPLFVNLNLGISNFKGELIPNLSDAKPKTNQLDEISFKFDFAYVYESSDELNIGLHYTDLKTKLFLQNEMGGIYDVGSNGSNIVAFIKYKFLRFENFGVDAGFRYNVTGFSKNGGGTIEPRISLTYRPHPMIAFKSAWGVYQQEVITLSDEDDVITLFEPWIITPGYLNPSKATHYCAGVELNLYEGISLDLEGYYKKVDDLATLNEKKIYPTDRDFVAGTGESYGFESLLNMNLDPVRFTAAYTLGFAYTEVDDWTYYPRYDSRHTLNLSLEFNLGNGWYVSGMWYYNSGLPFTQTMGGYDKLYPQDFNNDLFIISDYYSYIMLGDKNIGRLPDYHRMDLSLSKKFSLSFLNFYVNISVLNVYDRANIFYFDRETGERVNTLPLLPTATVKVEL